MAQSLVLGWLHDIAECGERFRELQAQGRERIGRQIGELRQAAGDLETKLSKLREQIQARIQEPTRTRVDTVRESIEQSIVDLEQERKEAEERRALHQAELRSLVAEDRDLFADCRRRIHEVLRKHGSELKSGLIALVSSLVLGDRA